VHLVGFIIRNDYEPSLTEHKFHRSTVPRVCLLIIIFHECFGFQKKDGSEQSSKPKARPAAGGTGLLPPPPGGVKISPPAASGNRNTPTSSPSHQAPSKQTAVLTSSNVDLLLGASASVPGGQPARSAASGGESWGDFASAAQPR